MCIRHVAYLGIAVARHRYGMGGGDQELPSGDFLSVAAWVVVGLFLLSPFLLWRWRKDGRKEGF
jgi:hypothetical protein